MPKQTVSKTTPPLTDDQLAALRILMPQAFTEGKIDPEKLRLSLGDIVDDRPERYSFTWAGKRDAIRLLQVPSRATLIPARDESLDFDTTQNLFIEGDNLEVLKLLYKPYFGQVKMIYIDPPYNTGNDFVYPDNFTDPLDTYLRLTGQKDSEGNLLTSNPETGGRYHSAWLSMMYSRLFLARQLLREDGVIFVSIDDHEVQNLRLLMNEIFGEENFVASIVWRRTVSKAVSGKGIAVAHDYIICYGRSNELVINKLPVKEEKGYKNPDNDHRGPYKLQKLERTLEGARPTMTFPIQTPNGTITRTWSVHPSQYEFLLKDNRIVFSKSGHPNYKQFLSEFKGSLPDTWWDKKGSNQDATRELKALFDGEDLFSNPKPIELIKTLLLLSTQSDSLIVDFFAGSCTTAQAMLELNREDGGNRRFIMVQLPEPTGNKQFTTIAEIGKERIRRVVARMKKAREGQMQLDKPEDLGFKVFKLAASNYRQWGVAAIHELPQQSPAAYTHQAEMFADPLVEGWQPENVLYEVALKEGYGLNVMVEQTSVKDVQRVVDPDKGQFFYLTLAAKIALEDLRPLDLKKDDLFICRDAALDDEAAANLALQCRLKTI
jgi:adenine-specific DNA-methyltransferase